MSSRTILIRILYPAFFGSFVKMGGAGGGSVGVVHGVAFGGGGGGGGGNQYRHGIA